jgi:hypothetical protein
MRELRRQYDRDFDKKKSDLIEMVNKRIDDQKRK